MTRSECGVKDDQELTIICNDQEYTLAHSLIPVYERDAHGRVTGDIVGYLHQWSADVLISVCSTYVISGGQEYGREEWPGSIGGCIWTNDCLAVRHIVERLVRRDAHFCCCLSREIEGIWYRHGGGSGAERHTKHHSELRAKLPTQAVRLEIPEYCPRCQPRHIETTVSRVQVKDTNHWQVEVNSSVAVCKEDVQVEQHNARIVYRQLVCGDREICICCSCGYSVTEFEPNFAAGTVACCPRHKY